MYLKNRQARKAVTGGQCSVASNAPSEPPIDLGEVSALKPLEIDEIAASVLISMISEDLEQYLSMRGIGDEGMAAMEMANAQEKILNLRRQCGEELPEPTERTDKIIEV